MNHWLVGNHWFVRSRSRLVGSRGRLVRSRSWFVGSRSRLVGSRSRLVRSRGRLVGFLLRINRFSFILDISNIAFRSSTVGNNLYPTIRKVDSVLASSVVIFSLFLLREDRSVVRVIYSILVIVARSNCWIGVLMVGHWG